MNGYFPEAEWYKVKTTGFRISHGLKSWLLTIMKCEFFANLKSEYISF